MSGFKEGCHFGALFIEVTESLIPINRLIKVKMTAILRNQMKKREIHMIYWV